MKRLYWVRDILLGLIVWYFWGFGAFLFSSFVSILNYCILRHSVEREIDNATRVIQMLANGLQETLQSLTSENEALKERVQELEQEQE